MTINLFILSLALLLLACYLLLPLVFLNANKKIRVLDREIVFTEPDIKKFRYHVKMYNNKKKEKELTSFGFLDKKESIDFAEYRNTGAVDFFYEAWDMEEGKIISSDISY